MSKKIWLFFGWLVICLIISSSLVLAVGSDESGIVTFYKEKDFKGEKISFSCGTADFGDWAGLVGVYSVKIKEGYAAKIVDMQNKNKYSLLITKSGSKNGIFATSTVTDIKVANLYDYFKPMYDSDYSYYPKSITVYSLSDCDSKGCHFEEVKCPIPAYPEKDYKGIPLDVVGHGNKELPAYWKTKVSSIKVAEGYNAKFYDKNIKLMITIAGDAKDLTKTNYDSVNIVKSGCTASAESDTGQELIFNYASPSTWGLFPGDYPATGIKSLTVSENCVAKIKGFGGYYYIDGYQKNPYGSEIPVTDKNENLVGSLKDRVTKITSDQIAPSEKCEDKNKGTIDASGKFVCTGAKWQECKGPFGTNSGTNYMTLVPENDAVCFQATKQWILREKSCKNDQDDDNDDSIDCSDVDCSNADPFECNKEGIMIKQTGEMSDKNNWISLDFHGEVEMVLTADAICKDHQKDNCIGVQYYADQKWNKADGYCNKKFEGYSSMDIFKDKDYRIKVVCKEKAVISDNKLIAEYEFENNADAVPDDNALKGTPSQVTYVTYTPKTAVKENKAIDFSGSGYVSIPNKVLTGLNDFTIMLWVRPTQGTGNILKTSSQEAEKFLISNPSQLTINFKNKTSTFPAINLADSKWHPLAVTRKGSTLKVYFEGVHKGTMTFGGDSKPLSLTKPLLLGNNFKGQMDELKFYNYALTPEEITKISADEGLVMLFSTLKPEGTDTGKSEGNILGDKDKNGCLAVEEYNNFKYEYKNGLLSGVTDQSYNDLKYQFKNNLNNIVCS